MAELWKPLALPRRACGRLLVGRRNTRKKCFSHRSTQVRVRCRGKLGLHTLTGANEGTDMGKTPEKKSSGKKAPFGTTKGAFGKEGKGGKGRGGRPLGKMVSTSAPPLFSGGT